MQTLVKKESYLAPQNCKPLRYDVVADKEAYHIVFNLSEKGLSPIDCFLNEVERNLVILPNSEATTFNIPCIFKAPDDANLHEVRIQSRKGIHLISVPRLQYIST